MHFVWGTLLATLPAVKLHFAIVLGFAVAELLLPARRRQPFREHFSNVQYVLLYFFVTPFALILPSALAVAVARKFGPGLISMNLESLGPGLGIMAWPVRNILLPFIPLAIFDFFYYWHHRFQHRIPALWATHRLHHSIESLNALAAYRIHWLEEPLRIFTIVVPMSLLLQITPVQGAWIAFALAQIGILIHSNLRLPYGRLTPVLVGPQLHRLHHSSADEHQDKNYAGAFPFWDILFGTYISPRRGEWPPTGLRGGEHSGNVFEETAHPFLAWGKATRAWLFQARPNRISAAK